ncbi:MAG: 30S ribosomal protein S21 [Pelagibacterales bacterium]|nr:30S ribosomal protein S21 [Pelagibacterales bacterium]
MKNFKRRKDDVSLQGLTVTVRNDDVNKALRIFKKKVTEEGIIQDYKARQEYIKPSEKRRKAKAAGRQRWLKKQSREKQERGY